MTDLLPHSAGKNNLHIHLDPIQIANASSILFFSFVFELPLHSLSAYYYILMLIADLYWVLTLPARPSPLHVCACHSFSPLNSEIRWVLLLPLYLQERKLRLREVNYVARDNCGPKDLGLKHEAGLPQVHKHLKYLCIAHKALRTKPCTGSVC